MLSKSQNKALWNAFREGNREAFQRIYELHSRELVGYGYKITSNVQLVEDSIHDLFIELWQSRANLSETDSIKFYLFRSLRNKIQRVQQRDVFYNATSMDMLPEVEEEDNFMEQKWLRPEGQEQLYRQLREGYQQLSPRQQQAIDLRFTHHFSNEEIARIMGINYQSACKFIYSALKILRETVRIFCVSLLLLSSFLTQRLF
ncbi:RNA polymerase sigma factor [Arundinibacter roseus]|uniref:Sigma-70 family RNA polymerase sigma factor n=1 Tax=Arundinibacter roseus TaxID=2070510 RepID=A0A4R4K4I5_9BACT|nr:sigma-70 family RNA polymerase sigma factor [Arundinibacter roseus]TDB62337.1 sigma-70 family RNA polymerase sigma factor [Arundinibacter roseus]